MQCDRKQQLNIVDITQESRISTIGDSDIFISEILLSKLSGWKPSVFMSSTVTSYRIFCSRANKLKIVAVLNLWKPSGNFMYHQV
jgi:hypothetical protein